jgi:hypothetical protein
VSKVDDDVRAVFSALANILIPDAEGMPAASAVGVHDEILDRILSLRPDLSEPFFRGVAAARGKDPRAALEQMNAQDAPALSAIGVIASAAYYMSPRVRSLIGYPGQERRVHDPQAVPEYVVNGMLKVVEDRGPIYRATVRPK